MWPRFHCAYNYKSIDFFCQIYACVCSYNSCITLWECCMLTTDAKRPKGIAFQEDHNEMRPNYSHLWSNKEQILLARNYIWFQILISSVWENIKEHFLAPSLSWRPRVAKFYISKLNLSLIYSTYAFCCLKMISLENEV